MSETISDLSAESQQKLAALSPAKRALFEQKLRQKNAMITEAARNGNAAFTAPRIERRAAFNASSTRRESRAEMLPLSFAQERFWFFEQWREGNIALNRGAALRIEGALQPRVLECALQEIVRRHEVLRTTFTQHDGEPIQQIAVHESNAENSQLDLNSVDLSEFHTHDQQLEAQKYASRDARAPFDLERGPLLRTTLLRLNEREHILLLTVHHIAFDGLSMAVFIRELSALYQAFASNALELNAPASNAPASNAPASNAPSPLPDLPIQYADFTLWQRAQMRGETLSRHLAFWKKALEGAPRVLELPADSARPSVQTTNGAQCHIALSPSLSQSLKTLSRGEGATLFMTLLAALQTVLMRLSGQDEFLVGTSVAGRKAPETENLIGFFVNTVVLRGDLRGDPTFRELLARVRRTCLEAYSHDDLPFEKLVEALQPERDLSRTPLFQTLFVLKNAPTPTVETTVDDSLLRFSPHEFDSEIANFDLALELWDKPEGIGGYFVYNTDLFARETVERWSSHFQTLLQNAVENPDARLSQLPILTPAETHQILVEWNRNAVALDAVALDAVAPDDILPDIEYSLSSSTQFATIQAAFEAQVAANPEAVAIAFDGAKLTYRELNARANRLARALQNLGVREETLVGICVERSPEMIVGVLGILKAGGVYVPIDASLPVERRHFLLQDARISVLIAQPHLRDKLAAHRVDLWLDDEKQYDKNVENLTDIGSPRSLAYVMYTSGSTGQPKGVCVEHGGVLRLVKGANYTRFAPNEVFSQLAPLSFDASTFEIWGALLNGARLEIFPRGVLSLEEIGQAIVEKKISTLWTTTGLFHQMIEEQTASLRGVRHIMTGGEVLSVVHALKARRELPQSRLTNFYGPTENTTFSTFYRIEEIDDARPIPIGKPISGTQVYLLDSALQPVPVGVAGELYCGGDGVARGYLNRPELTAEKFVTAFWGGELANEEVRLYRSGDRARWKPDGDIEFLGRIDNQIKLRGFRIELGEIEAAVRELKNVRKCAVILREEAPGDKRIVAYVVAPEASQEISGEDRVLDLAALRAELQTKLPDYMVPSAFVELRELPLTFNGKVDWRALPAPKTAIFKGLSANKNDAVARSEIEIELVALWEKLLRTSGIGIDDNFFDLGGHSLLATRLFAHIKTRWNQKLPMAILFQTPTIRQFADILKERLATQNSDVADVKTISIVPLQSAGSLPPFFLVSAGGVLFLGELARNFSRNQPFYSIQARGLDEDEKPLERVEEMASLYLKELRAIQPRGPYYLGGRCFGGIVAFEMAQQLRSCGEKVAALLILDSGPPNADFLRGKSVRLAGRFSGSHLKARVRYYCNRQALKKRWQKRGAGRIEPEPEIFQQLKYANVEAKRLYQAQIYDGDITLFRSDEFGTRKQQHLQWQNLTTKGFETCSVKGTHRGIFEKPYVGSLARQIEKCLREAREKTRRSL